MTITGLPRKVDSVIGPPPCRPGSEKAGAVVPAWRTGGGGASSAAELTAAGCGEPRTMTKTTKADETGRRCCGDPLEETILRAFRVLSDAGQRHRAALALIAAGPPEDTQSG